MLEKWHRLFIPDTAQLWPPALGAFWPVSGDGSAQVSSGDQNDLAVAGDGVDQNGMPVVKVP
jgi:hypothetical protein